MRYETCNPGQDHSKIESHTYPASKEEAGPASNGNQGETFESVLEGESKAA